MTVNNSFQVLMIFWGVKHPGVFLVWDIFNIVFWKYQIWCLDVFMISAELLADFWSTSKVDWFVVPNLWSNMCPTLPSLIYALQPLASTFQGLIISTLCLQDALSRYPNDCWAGNWVACSPKMYLAFNRIHILVKMICLEHLV